MSSSAPLPLNERCVLPPWKVVAGREGRVGFSMLDWLGSTGWEGHNPPYALPMQLRTQTLPGLAQLSGSSWCVELP